MAAIPFLSDLTGAVTTCVDRFRREAAMHAEADAHMKAEIGAATSLSRSNGGVLHWKAYGAFQANCVEEGPARLF